MSCYAAFSHSTPQPNPTHFTVLDIIYNQVEVTHASPQWGKTANVQPLRVWDLIQKDVELADAIPYWRNAVHVKCLRFYNVM